MESIGQYLRKERELREISLKEIAHQTKISPFHLRALETDNFSVFPGEAFIRGFLHNYASCIGLDANDIVNRYLDQLHPNIEKEPTETVQPKTVKISLTEKPNPESDLKISFVAKMAFAVSGLIALYFLIFYTIAIWNRP
jgi:cytoskeletal protein RodZ